MTDIMTRRREPEWKDVYDGIQILFAPIGAKANEEGWVVYLAIMDDPDLGGIEGNLKFSEALREQARAITRNTVLRWRAGKDGEGEQPTADQVEAWMDDPELWPGIRDAHAMPWIMRSIEKNGSAGSPGGTGAEATPAKDTVTSPAPSAKTEKARAAKPIVKKALRGARTASTSRKRTKASPSGT